MFRAISPTVNHDYRRHTTALVLMAFLCLFHHTSLFTSIRIGGTSRPLPGPERISRALATFRKWVSAYLVHLTFLLPCLGSSCLAQFCLNTEERLVYKSWTQRTLPVTTMYYIGRRAGVILSGSLPKPWTTASQSHSAYRLEHLAWEPDNRTCPISGIMQSSLYSSWSSGFPSDPTCTSDFFPSVTTCAS